MFLTVCHKDSKRDLIMGFQSERKMADNHLVLFIFHVTKYYDTGTACARMASS
jgi:hypothetical protein